MHLFCIIFFFFFDFSLRLGYQVVSGRWVVGRYLMGRWSVDLMKLVVSEPFYRRLGFIF